MNEKSVFLKWIWGSFVIDLNTPIKHCLVHSDMIIFIAGRDASKYEKNKI